MGIEVLLGYNFKNKLLLDEALTHPSSSKQNPENGTVFNYERLEFLGDSVLGLVIAEILIIKFPQEKEGNLAKRQSALVRGETLAFIAEKLQIGQYIKMAQGEESSGGRSNKSNIENALEAIIGAIYLDSGLPEAAEFIHKHWDNIIETMSEPPKDPKTTLQEWSQGRGLSIPQYEVLETTGPSHDPRFKVSVKVEGYEPSIAEGDSKKKAEKIAAADFLKKIGEI